MKYKVSNVSDFKNGWICGTFVDDGVLQNSDIEIKYDNLMPGDSSTKHSHPKSTMVILVLKGKVKFEINGDEHILEKNDFAFFEKGVSEKVMEVFEPTELICMRSPSLKNNKLELG